MNNETPTTEGIIGMCRFSFLTVFKPRLNTNNDRVEYSVTLMIPKAKNEFNPDPEATLKKVVELTRVALGEKFASVPAVWINPLKDGDKEIRSDTGEPKMPGYWYINASAKEGYPPLLIDGEREKVTHGWQSGDWGMVKLKFFGYDQKGKKGVSCGLRAVQFLRHDEPIGGSGITTPDEFDIVEGADKTLQGAVSWDDTYDPLADA